MGGVLSISFENYLMVLLELVVVCVKKCIGYGALCVSGVPASNVYT